MPLNGIDPAAKTPSRIRRNWSRTTKGAITTTILTTVPVVIDGTGSVALDFAANPGLVTGAALSILLNGTGSTSGLVLAAGGLSLKLSGTNSGLTLTTGLAANVDGTTLNIVANALAVKAGGIGAAQLGILTTKGDLLAFSTTATRVAVGTDGQVLTADSTSAAGVKWASVSTSSGNGTVTAVGLAEGNLFTVSGSPVTAAGTLTLTLNNQTSNTFFAGPLSGSAATPTFRALSAGDLATGGSTGQVLTLAGTDNHFTWTTPSTASGTVTAVGLSEGTIFTVGSSPVTTAGTITLTPISQAVNTLYAGPLTGSSAAPTFRSLGAADMATGGSAGQVLTLAGTDNHFTWTTPSTASGNGTVTAVGLSEGTLFTVSGSPVTTAGTITLTPIVQNAQRFFAGPASGTPGVPTFRAIGVNDLASGGALDSILMADSSFLGVKWFAKGSVGQILTMNASARVVWAASPVGVSVTTKGDIQTFDTVANRLPVGSDGTVLTADSTQTTGLKWASAGGGVDLGVVNAMHRGLIGAQ